MNETQKFKQFNELYDLKNKELTHEQALTTLKLILDEAQEFINEFFTEVKIDIVTGEENRQIPWPNIPNAAKELEDIRYITGQQMAECGMDVQGIGDEVHRSNMSKKVDAKDCVKELDIALKRYPKAYDSTKDYKTFVLKCAETGKVIRPTTYKPALITGKMIGIE